MGYKGENVMSELSEKIKVMREMAFASTDGVQKVLKDIYDMLDANENSLKQCYELDKEDTTKKQIHIIGSIRTNYADFISSTYNLRKVAEMSEVAVCFRHIMTFVKTL
jgi:uncharacterized protein YacL